MRMEDFRVPKKLLFGELTKTCPRHGPKKRWRDLAVTDVRTLGIERDWFKIAQGGRHHVNSFILLLVLEIFVLLQNLLQLQFFGAHVDEFFSALET